MLLLTKLTPAAANAAICAAVNPAAAAAGTAAPRAAAGAAAAAAAAAAGAAADGVLGVDGVKPVLLTIGLVEFIAVGAVDETDVDVGATPTILLKGTGVLVNGKDAVPVPSDDKLVKSPACGVLTKLGFKTDPGNCCALVKSPKLVPADGVVGVVGVVGADGVDGVDGVDVFNAS